MREYMPTRGSLGRDMMFRSCTIQVNLDFESEADMVQKMRVGMALQVGAGWLAWGRRAGPQEAPRSMLPSQAARALL